MIGMGNLVIETIDSNLNSLLTYLFRKISQEGTNFGFLFFPEPFPFLSVRLPSLFGNLLFSENPLFLRIVSYPVRSVDSIPETIHR